MKIKENNQTYVKGYKDGKQEEQERILKIIDKWLFEHQAFIVKGKWSELKSKIKGEK